MPGAADPHPRFAGLSLDRPLIMGIVNVTPDSFSDGGETATAEAAIARGRQMTADGADIIDVGGESTRPGAEPVPVEEEIDRVLPVVRALAENGAVVSIDTRHAAVMRAALDCGATIVNDVTALMGDSESADIVAQARASVILMHMQGTPQTMQKAPNYNDVTADIVTWLRQRVQECLDAGIQFDRIAIDPGIGFGKTLHHNLGIMRSIRVFAETGHPVCIGASRKSFIGALSDAHAAKDRIGGSIAAALSAIEGGAAMVRVHDVAETAQAIVVWRAMRS